jgi:uncharacterized membrane protein YkoI
VKPGLRRLLLGAGLLGAGLGLIAGPGRADVDQEQARRLRQDGRILPLASVLNRARAMHPGRVLEVELDERGGRYVYEIELLDPVGRVWRVLIDARTAVLLENRETR